MADEGKDESTLAWAEGQARAYLADPASVDPALAPMVVRLAAYRGDRALFDEYRRRFEGASEPGVRDLFLDALGAFRDPAIIREAYAYSLTGPLRPPEMFSIPMTIGRASEAAADRGFE